ncbi:unnamed protein product [Prorocentrum cordatum]|uniref:Uncharacterized protein n=1 Tax=Prorocentrum cordatum TaxID=2364126 RepID=A0ABN9REZ0_9DINO|nr:unnamed protein product [Polarella glacialis]
MAEKSKHDMVKLKNKWSCTACRQSVTADALLELVDTQCDTTFATANVIVDVKGDRRMGNAKLHPTHTVTECTKYGLLVCAKCAAYGTTIGKGLRETCEEIITKSGQDALNRIGDGIYPGYRSPPKAALEAERARLVRQMHDQELLVREGLQDRKSLKHGVGFIEWGKLWRQVILQMECVKTQVMNYDDPQVQHDLEEFSEKPSPECSGLDKHRYPQHIHPRRQWYNPLESTLLSHLLHAHVVEVWEGLQDMESLKLGVLERKPQPPGAPLR